MPILASITKSAATVHRRRPRPARWSTTAIALAAEPHRGPVFLDFPLDVFGPSAGDVPAVDAGGGRGRRARPRRRRRARPRSSPAPSGRRSSSAATSTGPAREDELRRRRRAPAGPGVHQRARPRHAAGRPRAGLPAHPRRCSSSGPTSSSCSARRSTSGSASAASATATVAHVVDAESQRAAHVDVLTVAGDIAATLRGARRPRAATRVDHEAWIAELRAAEEAARAAEAPLLAAAGDPIKPTRIYGELRQRLARDAVVICDGGDFASVRRQVRRGVRARLLARHRPVRLPRQRDGLLDRGPRRPARRPGRRRCSATAPPGSA